MSASPVTPQTAPTRLPSGECTTRTGGLPSEVQIIQMGIAIWGARAVYAAARLGLADLLAAGPRTVEELALATGTHGRSLHRLLRALASQGVLTEAEPRRFALTPLGAALRSDAPGAARATIMTLAGDWQWKAWDHFLYSLQTGMPGMGRAHGMGVFQYLATHPEDGARFNEAMVGLYGSVGSAVVSAYDFSRCQAVVDLGGGTGLLLAEILRAHENGRGILFERPEVIPQARRTIEAANLSARCRVVEGDFFTSVPAGHDTYLLSHVLHDWTDERALAILRNCRDAIANQGRLLIIEAVLPPGDMPHHSKLIDLVMLTVTGGVERSAEEYASLLAAAGFRLLQIHPTTTHQSIVEAVPA
jgi:SAM-dependent methyltransferase